MWDYAFSEYSEARDWIDKHLQFDINRDVNLFEVTIRVLGGLLSIYHLTSDKMYLDKSVSILNNESAITMILIFVFEEIFAKQFR